MSRTNLLLFSHIVITCRPMPMFMIGTFVRVPSPRVGFVGAYHLERANAVKLLVDFALRWFA